MERFRVQKPQGSTQVPTICTNDRYFPEQVMGPSCPWNVPGAAWPLPPGEQAARAEGAELGSPGRGSPQNPC